MIVAVTMRLAPAPDYPEERDAISHDWLRMLEGMGVTPVPLPNALSDPVDYLRRVGAAGVVLSGGGSVAEPGGGAEPTPRDATERLLIDHALAGGAPLFAVCRGLQALNTHLGGGLERGSARPGHVGGEHAVRIEKPPGRTSLSEITVNSFHADAIEAAAVAPDLRPFAWAHDGLVEGVAHRERPIVGVQWHPERPNPGRALDDSLIGWWLSRCA